MLYTYICVYIAIVIKASSFTFTEILRCQQKVKKLYISTRFNIQRDIWQLLHPKHFVNLLLIHHTGCNREKDILDVATIMSHGLTLSKSNLQVDNSTNDANSLGLLECFATHTEPEGPLRSIKTNKISDIFQPFKSSDGSTIIPKYILIEGAPGMGKTHLCKEIAYEWAKGCLLKDTELLFLIYLRDPNILNIQHLEDLVHYFYNFDKVESEMSRQCAKTLNNRENNDVTIVCDGYDEFDSSKDSLIAKILDRKALSQCRIVVTSRLTASDRLHRIADVRVEVLGFSDESKIQYIKQELKGNHNRIKNLQSYLDDHISIKSICYMPIMMTILVYVFNEKGYLPNNPVGLYDKFIAITISRYLQKQNKSDELFVSLHTLPADCKTFLNDVSKFAFITLRRNQKVFSKEELKTFCSKSLQVSSDLENLGLINSVKYFCTDKGSIHVFNFLHLSIHEYLAAYYLSTIDQCCQFNELQKTFLNKMYQETWNLFIAMNESTINFQNYSIYCNKAYHDCLSNWAAHATFSSLLECFVALYDIISTDAATNDVVKILFSRNDHSSNSAANTYREHICLSLCSRKNIQQPNLVFFVIDENIKYKNNLNTHWFKLLQNLRLRFSTIFYTNDTLLFHNTNQQQVVDSFKYETLVTQLTFAGCHISRIVIDTAKVSNLQYILHFQISSCSFEQDALAKLCNFLSSISTLLSITIVDNHFCTEQVDEISSVILNNCNLQILYLNNNCLHSDVIKVAKALEHTRTLKVLNLTNNDIPPDAATALSNIISSNTSLREFCVGNNKLKSSIIIILKYLHKISSLRRLELNDNEIPEEAGEAIASVILNNTKLEHLVLNNNNIGKGVFSIFKALQKVDTLKVLCLGNTNMPKKASEELALAIECNQFLNTLKLHSNNLQSSITVILQALSEISSLEILDLQCNELNEDVGQPLASVILNNHRLTTLLLNNNNIGKGILHIAKALQQIICLQVLGLSNTEMPKEVCNELALAIERKQCLNTFQLDDNNLQSSANVIVQALSKISSLKVLCLKSNHLTKDSGEFISSVILHNTGMEKLDLNNNNIGEGVLHIATALQKVTSLKSLGLGYNNFPTKVTCELSLAIKYNQGLRYLWLPCNSVEPTVLQSIGNISTLTSLNLGKTLLVQEAGEDLSSIILHNTKLVYLYLSGNDLREGALQVVKALQQITSLKVLDLGNCNLPKEICGELAHVIDCNKYLEQLLLPNNNLCSSTVLILQALSRNSTLKVIDLQGNHLTAEAGKHLASVALHGIRLEELYFDEGKFEILNVTSHRILEFGCSNIPEESYYKIEFAITSHTSNSVEKLWLHEINLYSSIFILNLLKNITTLKVLHLNGNQIHQEASKALATAILHNTGLEELHLSNSNLGQGALQVVNALQHITSLKVLDLGNCNLPKEICGELAHVIDCNKNLEQLLLPNNNLCSSTVLILQALSRNSTLRVIDLKGNHLTAEAGEHLVSVVLHNIGLDKLYFSEGTFAILLTSRRILEFDCSGIPETSYFKIEFAIKSHKYIEKLRLYKINPHSSTVFILNSLKTITTLKVLHFNNNQMNQEGSQALANIILHNTELEELNFNDNNLGKEMVEVAKSLQQITGLRLLNWSNDNISKSFSDELALAIKVNKHLEQLQLCNSNLKSSAIVILESLNAISALKLLNISDNQITDEAGEALASVVLHNKGLEELHLNNNHLGVGALPVVNALQ